MRSKLAFGAAAVAATASLTFAVNGLATSQVTGGLLRTPAANAEELTPFDDCDELLQWYVDRAVKEVGPYGFGGHYGVFYRSSVRDLADSSMAGAAPVEESKSSDAVSGSDSGTNVQEAGVDEPDRAKTDGSVVVHLRGRTLVVTDVSGDSPRELGTLRLPRSLHSAELLLVGDRVLVTAVRSVGWGRPIPVEPLIDTVAPARGFLPPPADENSRLLEVSIEDPSSPRIVSDQTLGGSLLSARQYDDTVRLVVRTGQPTLDFVFPDRDRTRAEARAENRAIVRNSTVDDWLPSLRVEGGEPTPLVDCQDVRHPATGAGFGTITVVTVPAADPTDLTTTAVTAEGDLVYSSTDRLYLATRASAKSTDVHAFELDGTTTSYLGSGRVDGTIRDRWSMDAHDGFLRVAVAHGQEWSPTDNGITVLAERSGELVEVGSVRDLGPREEIKSVRWFDDLALVVTFRQVDPLYTVDLSDPTRPRTLGELKIPGFSEYLHPVGDDRLLGLGVDATMRGMVRGGQASMFDVSDLSDPQRLDTLDLGKHARPATAYDPRAFTWLGTSALVAVEDQWNGRGSVVEIVVGEDGSITEGDSWRLPRWRTAEARTLPLSGDAVALVTSTVRLIRP
jgi:Beta propeller domain